MHHNLSHPSMLITSVLSELGEFLLQSQKYRIRWRLSRQKFSATEPQSRFTNDNNPVSWASIWYEPSVTKAAMDVTTFL